MMTEPNPNAFGQWTTTDERLQELANRLNAWYSAGDQLPEIFETACLNMQQAIQEFAGDDASMIVDAPKAILLLAFEDALDAFDNILEAFPQEWNDNDE